MKKNNFFKNVKGSLVETKNNVLTKDFLKIFLIQALIIFLIFFSISLTSYFVANTTSHLTPELEKIFIMSTTGDPSLEAEFETLSPELVKAIKTSTIVILSMFLLTLFFVSMLDNRIYEISLKMKHDVKKINFIFFGNLTWIVGSLLIIILFALLPEMLAAILIIATLVLIVLLEPMFRFNICKEKKMSVLFKKTFGKGFEFLSYTLISFIIFFISLIIIILIASIFETVNWIETILAYAGIIFIFSFSKIYYSKLFLKLTK